MIRAHDQLFRSLMEAPDTAYDDIDIDGDEIAADVLARLNQVSREG